MVVAAKSMEAQAEGKGVGLPKLVTEPRLYYRPSDIVRLTGISRTKIFRAIYTGELKAFQRDRCWLVPVDELKRWIEGGDRAA